jgi:TetR/AcrR family transcriptional repressor of nem operon
MRLTETNKKKIRDRILGSAAEVLRRDGYDAVNLDQIMRGAELTRGAFYAHFKSKSDLLRAVIRNEHPVLKMLKARDGEDATALFDQMHAIFEGYLNPSHLDEVFKGCTLAALTGDVTRAGDPVKSAYGDAWMDILEEMARAQPAPAAAFSTALVLASGAVRTAQAIGDPKLQADTLSAAWVALQHLLASAVSKRAS